MVTVAGTQRLIGRDVQNVCSRNQVLILVKFKIMTRIMFFILRKIGMTSRHLCFQFFFKASCADYLEGPVEDEYFSIRVHETAWMYSCDTVYK